MAGQPTHSHLRMAFGLPSMARRSGRWQLKPLTPRRRHTCPQGGLVTACRRASQEGLGDDQRLVGYQFGFAARRSLASQGGFASRFKRVLPTVSHLPDDAQMTGHLRCGTTFGKQSGRLLAALFQLGMVSCLRLVQTIHNNPTIVSRLCESQ